jgi:hypothetical protein
LFEEGAELSILRSEFSKLISAIVLLQFDESVSINDIELVSIDFGDRYEKSLNSEVPIEAIC